MSGVSSLGAKKLETYWKEVLRVCGGLSLHTFRSDEAVSSIFPMTKYEGLGVLLRHHFVLVPVRHIQKFGSAFLVL